MSGLNSSLMQSETFPGLWQKLVEIMQQLVDCMRGLGIEAEGQIVTCVPSPHGILAVRAARSGFTQRPLRGNKGLKKESCKEIGRRYGV